MKLGKRKKTPIQFEESSGNVFADLGLENPDVLLAKSTLITRIRTAMTKRKLTEAAAAKRLGLARADLAGALRGDLARFSISELKAFLQSLEIEGNGQKASNPKNENSNCRKAPC
jgi:predicted XRE-type DNA-binding protein